MRVVLYKSPVQSSALKEIRVRAAPNILCFFLEGGDYEDEVAHSSASSQSSKQKRNEYEAFIEDVRKRVICEALNDPKNLMVTITLSKTNGCHHKLCVKLFPSGFEFGRNAAREDKFMIYQDTKVSVTLKLADNSGKLCDFASVGDMTIGHQSHGYWLCEQRIPTQIKSFPCNEEIYLEIAADVKINEIFDNLPFTKKVTKEDQKVTIVSRQGTEIKTEKSILCECSDVFNAMFGSGMSESLTNIIDMSDVSEKGVQAFVHYINVGELTKAKRDAQIAYELMSIGHKYLIPNLQERAVEYLLERREATFSVELAFSIFMFTLNVDCGMEVLKHKSINILKRNLNKLHLLQEYKDIFETNETSNAALMLEGLFGKPDSSSM